MRVPNADCDNPADRYHHWYYINGGGYVPHTGSPAHGGSYQPASRSNTYSSAPESTAAGEVSRGGFGGTAEGHGGSGGGEGE